MNTTLPVILGGPSGVGKYEFCRFLEGKGWVYLEADETEKRHKSGIDQLGLKSSWDAFWTQANPEPLARELSSRKQQSSNIVLSLPSKAIPSPKHIEQSKGILSIRFLYGDPRFCLDGFLEREKKLKRGFDESFWAGNNGQVFCSLATSPYRPFLIDVFASDGSRLNLEDLLKAL